MLLINLAQSDIFNYPLGHHSTQTLLLHNNQQSLYFEKKDRYLNRYLGHIKDDFLVIKICKIYIQCQFNTFLSLSSPPPFLFHNICSSRKTRKQNGQSRRKLLGNTFCLHIVVLCRYVARHKGLLLLVVVVVCPIWSAGSLTSG